MQPHRPHEKGTPGDFGIKPDAASEMAKREGTDHLGRPAGDKMLGSGDSARTHGVGSTAGHPGKGSGGDLDLDVSGLEPGPDVTPEDAVHDAKGNPNVGGARPVIKGVQPTGYDAVVRGDHDNAESGGGIANTRNQGEDDSFASEITHDEATGEDQTKGGGG